MKSWLKLSLGILLFMSILWIFPEDIHAEGSKDLVENGGYRPFIEWQKNGGNTAGIPRRQYLQVYAKAGETIYFGSSVLNGYDKKDIVVTSPNGEVTNYDVKKGTDNNIGYIVNVTQEANGPNINGSEPKGYTPFVIEVGAEGFYTFEFHSPIEGVVAPAGYGEASKSNWDTNNEKKQESCVAAWDITVTDINGQIKDGRVFTNYLAINMGKNFDGYDVLKSIVYVLTKDGYLYRMNFNGMDPYGFIFFSNNVGFLNSSGLSWYHSTKSPNNDFVKSTIYGNIDIPSPQNQNTSTIITHRIFFNEPANDLPASINTTPQPYNQATNPSFKGTTDNETVVGQGGEFSFDADKDGNYQFEISNDSGELVAILATAATQGNNRILWNGKDQYGNEVPAGDYNIKVLTKGGEYHFPLIDVENNRNGFKVELLSDVTNIADDSFTDKTMVYYDNSNFNSGKTIVSFKGLEGTYLQGVSSADGAMKFINKTGDYTLLDTWTYVPCKSIDFSIKVAKAEEQKYRLEGTVFYDTDKSGDYNVSKGDYSLGNIKIELYNESDELIDTLITTKGGLYSTTLLPGKYTVKLLNEKGYEVTTNNQEQTINIEKTDIRAGDIGLVLKQVDLTTAIDVNKKTIDLASGLEQDKNIIFTVKAENLSATDALGVKVIVKLPEDVTYISDTASIDIVNSVYDASTGELTFDKLNKNKVVTFTITCSVNKVGDYEAASEIECGQAESDMTNNTDVTSYTVIKTEIPPETTPSPSETEPSETEPSETQPSETEPSETQPSETEPSETIPEIDGRIHYKYFYGYNDETAGLSGSKKKAYNEKTTARYYLVRQELSAFLYRVLAQSGQLQNNYTKPTTSSFDDLLNSCWGHTSLEYLNTIGALSVNNNLISSKENVTEGEVQKVVNITLNKDIGLGINSDKNIKRIDFLTRYNKLLGRSDFSIIKDENGKILYENKDFTNYYKENYKKYTFEKEMIDIDDEQHIDVLLACHTYVEKDGIAVIHPELEKSRINIDQGDKEYTGE